MSKKAFFAKMEELFLALSFNDVRLKTAYSEVLPPEVDLQTKFSSRVRLKIPLVSAAMDTVTEAPMAIEIAKHGGLGVIHRGMTLENQARAVGRVKMHMNGLINLPITVWAHQTLAQVEKMRQERNFTFGTFPVLDKKKGGKLVGLITQRHFDMCDNLRVRVATVMARDLVTAPAGTTLVEARALMQKNDAKMLPLVNAQGELAGMYVYSDIKRILAGDATSYNTDQNGQLLVAAAIGVGEEALSRAELLFQSGVDAVVIDTAHGVHKNVLATLRKLKKQYGSTLDVVAGNVSQPEAALLLAEAGADGIKVGQGPGSTCTTRLVAGIGCPQVTAIYRCVQAVKKFGIPVCADGGIVYPGDIAIAIGAGAHSVMLGNVLAGTDPTPGDVIRLPNQQAYKKFRGMGSLGAMCDSKASRERYGQGEIEESKLVPEGVEGQVPYKGPLVKLLAQYVGGLRSGMGYVGAKNIESMRRKADFDRITAAGFAESHPSIKITQEAPNYRREGVK